MWSLFAPPDDAVRRFLDRQRQLPFSYPAVGCTRGDAPAGYDADHNRVRLGTGPADYAAACDAVRRWAMFPPGWTRVTPADAPPAEGATVAMLAHALGLWWLNACRIAYTFDEGGPARRFGFAYGTLPGHVERGEERFAVEQLPDGSVWYDILAYSRPRYWATRLAYPLARRLQARFARDSKAALLRAVGGRP